MLRKMFFSFCILLTTLCIVSPLNACTSFVMKNENQLLYGRNLDWVIEDCFIMINKRGVSKTAMQSFQKNGGLGDSPARWTSKYGSLTFNQHGREIALSGMNEAGLVVSGMGVWGSKYPSPDSRPALWSWQWIQYQLDNFRTVQQVIASDLTVRLIPLPNHDMKAQYLVCDAEGNSAVIEFSDGKLVYYKGKTLPVKVLTNTFYAEALECLRSNSSLDSDRINSVARFKKTARMLSDKTACATMPAIDYAFSILNNVGFFDSDIIEGESFKPYPATEWSIVYDLSNRRVYFHTFKNHSKRYVDLSQFDFSCQTPVQVFNIHKNITGDVRKHFIAYTPEINRKLVNKEAFTAINPLINASDAALDRIYQYPDSTICRQ